MIRSTINYINSQIETLGIFSKLNGLTKIWKKGDMEFPAVYSGGGDLEAINFDYTLANVYHRISGSVGIEQSEDSATGCDILITETYPMRLVCYFPNKILGKDDEYSALRVSTNLKNILPALNLTSISNDFQLDSIDIELTGIDLDSFSVFDDEFSGIEYKIPAEYNLIALEYDIILTGSQNCFLNYDCE